MESLLLSGQQSSAEPPVPRTITVTYPDRATLPERLDAEADKLGLTTEELVMRYIAEGQDRAENLPGDVTPAETVEDFLILNGLFKPEN